MPLTPAPHRLFAVVLAVVVLASFGCSPESGAVTATGKVVYKSGGSIKPLVGGRVRLESVADPKITAQGEIGEDGTFSLVTLRDGRGFGGAIPGEYRAKVEPPGYADEDTDDGRLRRARGVVNARFLGYDTSGLRVTIAAGENAIAIEVAK